MPSSTPDRIAHAAMSDRRLLILVVGVGRSGTSVMTGILGQLGLHIPQPEIQANDTNPRGFGEPRWVVEFHRQLLRRLRVTVSDARPAAWDATGSVRDTAALRAWLSHEFAQSGVVVVKDPRTAWFLPLWAAAAAELGIDTGYVTMLRHPAEVVRSAVKSYGSWQTETSRTAGYLNGLLGTEHLSRGTRRAFVRYEDLLADWPAQVRTLGTILSVPALELAERQPVIDAFVDPTLHRNRARWDGLPVPERLLEVAEGAWREAQRLVEADDDAARAALDEIRAAYGNLYAEAEAISQSSVIAVQPIEQIRPPRTPRARLLRLLPRPMRHAVRAMARRLRGAA